MFEAPKSTVLENFTPQVSHRERASSHERPEGGGFDYDRLPVEEMTLSQRVAAATGGIVTAANGVTVAGFAAFAKGGIEYSRGNYGKAALWMIGARACDMADGAVAEYFKTRGPTGAMLDATVDKFEIAAAMFGAAKTGLISPSYASSVALQHGANVYYNGVLQKNGGEPNPNEPGKKGLAALSGEMAARVAERAAATKHPRVARWAGRIATGARIANVIYSTRATWDYRTQAREAIRRKHNNATA